MKKLILAIVFTLVIGVGFGVAEQHPGPETIILMEGGKKPARLPHAEHQSRLECVVCHHTIDGAESKVKKCGSCHNGDMTNEKLNSYKKIGHTLCKGCHKAAENKTAPTKCTGCHIKKAT
jgi:predicted CXXCH cytochrome family protein